MKKFRVVHEGKTPPPPAAESPNRKWVYSRGYGAPMSHCLYRVADGYWHVQCGQRADLEGWESNGIAELAGMRRCEACTEKVKYHDSFKKVKP